MAQVLFFLHNCVAPSLLTYSDLGHPTGIGAPWRVTKRCGSQQALLRFVRSDCIARSDLKDARVTSKMAAAWASTGRTML